MNNETKKEVNKPDEALQLKIDKYFSQLEIFINKLPLNEEGKNYIWFHSFIQFYDTLIGSETGKPTYGIQTEWQLQRFIEQFKTNFQKLRLKRMEAYSKELENLPPLVAKDKINKELHRIKRKEIFAEIGGRKPTDWDKWLQNYLTHEELFIVKIAPLPNALPPPQEQLNTFCRSMPLSIPKEHFKKLIETKSKNDQPHLTIEQYDLFIERAFCGKIETPKQEINKVPRGEKLLIQALFYEFYDNYCFMYFNTMQCQDNFIRVLTDNFVGWDFQNVKNNFKPKIKKRL